ncbi:PIN domain-like protein, partial [Mycena haematopus]
ILARAAQIMSFKQLVVAREFRDSQTGAMVVGIDGCLWITQCQAVFHNAPHAQMGRNPELRTLFYKVSALNNAGVIAVFVFDGHNRPTVKRNKRVKPQPHWLIEEFKEIISLFGFYSYTAPGEAEAELAWLNRRGYIDTVLSDDGDTVLFGARRAIRGLNRGNKDEITLYTSAAMQSNPAVGLTSGGVLLLAILGGGDYDTVGLAGCGVTTAYALARCGLGDSLLEAAQTLVGNNLEYFLVGWRAQLRAELATNSRGHLKSKQATLSNKVPDTFPSLQVLNLYVHPVMSWSESFFPPDFDSWIVKLPALPALALYCNRKFGWTPLDMVGRLKKFVFPGMCVRRLNLQLHDHVVLGRVKDGHPALSSFLSI